MAEEIKLKKGIDMTNGPLLKKLLVFAIPLVLSGVLQLLFNAADLVVIGHFSTTRTVSLAAVSSNNSLINLFVNVAIGISLGANVVMAQAIGEGDSKKAERVVHTSMLIAIIISFIIMIVGTVWARTFLEWMQADSEVIDKAYTYLFIYFFGAPANIIYNFGAAILRAKGDTKRPLIFLTIAGVLNVGLNLILVIVVKMDVAGVAVATIASQYVSALLIIIALLNEKGYCKFRFKKLKIHTKELKLIVKVGLPSGILSSFFSIANILIQSSINTFGAVIIAGNATGQSIEAFIYTSMNAVSSTASTFSGQNYGANKIKRIKRVMVDCALIEVMLSVVVGGLFMLLRYKLAALYTTDPAVIKAAGDRMMVILPIYFTCGVTEVLVGGMRGMNYAILPMCASFVSVCLYRIIWVFTAFVHYKTPSTLYLSYPISWVINLIIDAVMITIVFKKVVAKRDRERMEKELELIETNEVEDNIEEQIISGDVDAVADDEKE